MPSRLEWSERTLDDCDYPWYGTASSADTLQQGDFIERCPLVTPIVSPENEITKESNIEVRIRRYNVIVLSQSCDIQFKKIDSVVLCPQVPLTTFQDANPYFRGEDGFEELKNGHTVGFHLLNKSSIIGFER